MIAFSDVAVSFDVTSANGSIRVVPYVVSVYDTGLDYDMHVLKSGASGTSNVSQSGSLHLRGGESRAVSTLAVSSAKGEACKVSITLMQAGRVIRTVSTDCGTGSAYQATR
ncbi:curli-like amyloid fiber formation chaperone CsgH [Caballeronia sp. GAFFF2]|uniref:curli-like amyloid fiber formation chaperone CsgH n=1 Tax=Caballeronia sp. GAFFF2 TaxID=2921741 RepID=UPI0020294900|nr:curli-like amyloid fiber formation chaperone CsgH [Caballeronia sp. GAFFF2]